MTEEQREKGNELNARIRTVRERLNALDKMPGRASSTMTMSKGDYVPVPVTLESVIITLIRAEYEKELRALVEEFRAL